MKYEYDLSSIKGVKDDALIYDVGGEVKKIDIKQSADIWWDIHNKPSIGDIIFRRKSKNKYAGGKRFNFTELYIRVYAGEDEIVFKKSLSEELDSSDACELRQWWDQINFLLNQDGYWFFDEG